jgi:hypothetical protein
VVYSECYQEKFFQYKIKGQSKPFIDQNLQLQLPGVEMSSENSDYPLHNPIYSHYFHNLPFASYLPNTFREGELNQAMANAQLSYTAWKKLHQQLLEASQIYLSQPPDQKD